MIGVIFLSLYALHSALIFAIQSQDENGLPLLSPYKLSERIDPFERFEESKRESIRSLFTPAFFDPTCGLETKTIIKPMYYWPGDSVKLKCVSCVEQFVTNGVAKHWAVFNRNIPESIADLDTTLEIDIYGNEEWVILDDSGAEQIRENYTMKSYIPGQDIGNITHDTRIQRAKMTFAQRDGYLIINNTDISNYGLYRCFDRESRFDLQVVYYLIPITPIYEHINFKEFSNECEGEQYKDFWRFDGYHQWRFFPRLLVNSNWSKECVNNKCEKYAFDEAKLDTDPIAIVRPESLDPASIVPKFNLEIFLKWSEWTSCKNNRTHKTRTGFCHIRKSDPNREFLPDLDNLYHIYTWLTPIHQLLENVEEFRNDGIMLFSGVLSSLLLNNAKLPQHCTEYPRRNWDEMHKAIIVPLIEKAINSTMEYDVKITASLCFRMVKFANSSQIIFGHPLIQNESCYM